MTKHITAIISGGGSGLGLSVAQAYIEKGIHVSVFDHNKDLGEKLKHQYGDKQLSFYCVDVTDEQSVKTAVEHIVSQGLAIRLAVNCAGIAPAKRMIDREGNSLPLSSFKQVIDVNLIGTFNVCNIVASAMSKNDALGEANERGLIINTASVAGFEGQIGQTAYAASKGGIIGLCLPMARELAALGIRVNTIAPGVMGTPLLLSMPDKVQESLVQNVQFPKRLGLPDEFAKLVMHMQENHYLNGETIRLDGALRMPPK